MVGLDKLPSPRGSRLGQTKFGLQIAPKTPKDTAKRRVFWSQKMEASMASIFYPLPTSPAAYLSERALG